MTRRDAAEALIGLALMSMGAAWLTSWPAGLIVAGAGLFFVALLPKAPRSG